MEFKQLFVCIVYITVFLSKAFATVGHDFHLISVLFVVVKYRLVHDTNLYYMEEEEPAEKVFFFMPEQEECQEDRLHVEESNFFTSNTSYSVQHRVHHQPTEAEFYLPNAPYGY